nr:putative inactive cadmium/zinc-transporting ATPase HMA3 [Tanacetum cinerariifolium]
GGSIFLKDYWEAATIVFLLNISEWLETRASHKATAVKRVTNGLHVLCMSGLRLSVPAMSMRTLMSILRLRSESIALRINGRTPTATAPSANHLNGEKAY